MLIYLIHSQEVGSKTIMIRRIYYGLASGDGNSCTDQIVLNHTVTFRYEVHLSGNPPIFRLAVINLWEFRWYVYVNCVMRSAVDIK